MVCDIRRPRRCTLWAPVFSNSRCPGPNPKPQASGPFQQLCQASGWSGPRQGTKAAATLPLQTGVGAQGGEVMAGQATPFCPEFSSVP